MKILGTLFVLLVSFVGVWAITRQDQQAPQQSPDLSRGIGAGERVNIASIANIANARGITKVTLSLPIDRQAIVRDFDDAVARHFIAIAQLVEKNSRVADPTSLNVTTFYRLKIVNSLGDKQTKCCASGDEIPETLPQLGEDEIYLKAIGGTAVFEGVEFTQEEAIGQLAPGQKYLFFLSSKTPGKLASVFLGAGVVYKITDSSDRIATENEESSRLARLIDQEFGGSLDKLKEGVKLSHQKSAR